MIKEEAVYNVGILNAFIDGEKIDILLKTVTKEFKCKCETKYGKSCEKCNSKWVVFKEPNLALTFNFEMYFYRMTPGRKLIPLCQEDFDLKSIYYRQYVGEPIELILNLEVNGITSMHSHALRFTSYKDLFETEYEVLWVNGESRKWSKEE